VSTSGACPARPARPEPALLAPADETPVGVAEGARRDAGKPDRGEAEQRNGPHGQAHGMAGRSLDGVGQRVALGHCELAEVHSGQPDDGSREQQARSEGVVDHVLAGHGSSPGAGNAQRIEVGTCKPRAMTSPTESFTRHVADLGTELPPLDAGCGRRKGWRWRRCGQARYSVQDLAVCGRLSRARFCRAREEAKHAV
jgi:hypothetical protein